MFDNITLIVDQLYKGAKTIEVTVKHNNYKDVQSTLIIKKNLCMLLLDCGTAFQLSYAQLHLSTLFDAN
jgi:hypothetical protein